MEDEEDGLEQSWWANMPHELLREVLQRIESEEDTWPPRRTVVACAGVCRTWRLIVKEMVKPPQLSSYITFPISLKQPGPREHLLQCFIRRNSGTQTYYLFLSLSSALADDGKFLLAARKFRRPTCTDYIISLDADMSRESNAYVGKLRCTLNPTLLPLLFSCFLVQRLTCFSLHLMRSNFLGTKFTIYDSQLPLSGAKITKSPSTKLVNPKQVSPRVPTGNYPVAHISYELNVLGSRGPRRMHCVMDTIPASAIEPEGVAPSQTHFSVSNIDTSFPFFQTNSTRLENYTPEHQSNKKDDVLVLKNKAARWHEQLQCWCLNFHGRVTIASVKNFQLAASPESGHTVPQEDEVILQFGKVGKDLFTMDYRYPISAFQAFAICLSSFATTVACE